MSCTASSLSRSCADGLRSSALNSSGRQTLGGASSVEPAHHHAVDTADGNSDDGDADDDGMVEDDEDDNDDTVEDDTDADEEVDE